jgi:hypothetical protein
MKSILYVGATLMIGASIYGFVDYKRTSQSKQFKNMYEPAATKEATVAEESSAVMTEPVSPTGKKEEKTTAETVVVKKKSSPELASTVRAAAGKSKKMRSKKLDHRLFSRAPLRERQEEVKLPVAVVDSLAKIVKPKAEL